MQTLKKWWPSAIFLLAPIFNAELPAIQRFVGQHEQISAALVGIAGILAHILQSPLAPSKN
jgi:energy-converting hydrogenase Eha subunit A